MLSYLLVFLFFFLILAGLSLLFSGLSSHYTIKYLKEKGADSESDSVGLDGLGIWKYNWVILFRNRRSIIFKNDQNKFWYSEENSVKYKNLITMQIVFGVIELIFSIFLIVFFVLLEPVASLLSSII